MMKLFKQNACGFRYLFSRFNNFLTLNNNATRAIINELLNI